MKYADVFFFHEMSYQVGQIDNKNFADRSQNKL